jgi:hypothetical protein
MKPSIQELIEQQKNEYFHHYWLNDKELISEHESIT